MIVAAALIKPVIIAAMKLESTCMAALRSCYDDAGREAPRNIAITEHQNGLRPLSQLHIVT
jgi:hypothetical protein